MKKNFRMARFLKVPLTLIALLILGVTPALAGSNSTTLPNGANLQVAITSPTTSTQYLADGAPINVPVTGTASIGVGRPDATLVYVMDNSGSTSVGGGTGCAPILTCEKQFFLALNSAAVADGSVDRVGLARFGSGSVVALPLTAPNSPTVAAAINGTNADGGNTNFAAGLQAATTLVNASTNGTKIVVFASDGVSNEGGGSFAGARNALAATGAVVYSIAIGNGSSCGGGTDGTLNQVAANGGTCTHVTDPGNLPSIIPNLIGSTLQKLELSVDGGAPVQIPNSGITPDLPVPGAASVTYNTQANGLNPGDHTICVTAFGSTAQGDTGSVKQCETIHVYDLLLTPATATNELGSDNEHTVTATLQGPAGGAAPVVNRLVSFSVGGQNAGETGTCAPANCQTNAAGVVTFTYDVPVEPASLGDDTISASLTLANPTGATDTEQVAKRWVDTTPPVSSCLQSVNPNGNNTPGNNSHGGPNGPQNPDGFYKIGATDDVWPASSLDVFVRDTGSGTVFGPYAVDTVITYTENNSTPDEKKMGSANGSAGAVTVHISGNGDAAVYAVDDSGNKSAEVSCLVPPKPQ